ncbi:MAG: SurA N-terminal domain-containing protein [Candidatus Omnitrophica bacterium]|nr:SurA N-terminal domain-containing protein [Candidatus Omnitrophota bacterium]
MLRWLQKKKNMAAVVVAGVGILTALWGVGGVLEQRIRPGPAGTIGGRRVSADEFQHSRQATLLTLRLLYGTSLPAELVDDEAWRRLVMLAEVRRRNLQVTDAEIVQRLQQLPWLQRNGFFARDLYDQFLRVILLDAHQFEEIYRENLLLDRLQQAVREEVTIPDAQLREEFHRRRDRFRIGYLRFAHDDFLKAAAASATDEQLSIYYQAHQSEFHVPARRSIAYVLLPTAELERTHTVTDDEIASYYDTHAALKTKPLAEVHTEIASLLKARKLTEARKVQRARLEALLDENKTLEEIGTILGHPTRTSHVVAAADEEIPDLGTEPLISQEAFRLTVGERSDVIQAGQGLVVLQVTGEEPEQISPLDQVRAKVREEYLKQEARQAALTRATELRQALVEQLQPTASPADPAARLQQVAKTLKLKVRWPRPFHQNEAVEGLGPAAALAAALAGLKPLELTTAVNTEESVVIAQLLERLPAPDEEFHQEQATLKQELLQRQQSIHYGEWMRALQQSAERFPASSRAP